MDKSPWDSNAVFIFNLCFLGSFIKNAFSFASFWKFSCSSPSPNPIQSWNSEKILDTRINVVCGVRGWLGMCWLENAPEMLKCLKSFVQDCSFTIYSENLYKNEVRCTTIPRKICIFCLKWHIKDNVYNQLTCLKIFSRNSLFTRHNRCVVGRNLYEAGQKEHQVTIPAKSSSTEWNTIIHHCDHKPIGQRNIESPRRDLRIPT